MEPASMAAAHYELSIVTLFLQADWVVKAEMIGLAGASNWCWTVIFNRVAAFALAQRAIRSFESAFLDQPDLAQLRADTETERAGLAPIFAAGMREWQLSAAENAAEPQGMRERIGLAVRILVSG